MVKALSVDVLVLPYLNVERNSTKEIRFDGTLIRLVRLGFLERLGSPGLLGSLGDQADLVAPDVFLPPVSPLVLGVLGVLEVLGPLLSLVFLVFLVVQSHPVLPASQLDLAVREYLVLLVVLLVPLDQLLLVVLDSHRVPADLAAREYLVLPVVLPVQPVLGGLEHPLLAVVDAFRAVLGYSKWQAAIKSPKLYIL